MEKPLEDCRISIDEQDDGTPSRHLEQLTEEDIACINGFMHIMGKLMHSEEITRRNKVPSIGIAHISDPVDYPTIELQLKSFETLPSKSPKSATKDVVTINIVVNAPVKTVDEEVNAKNKKNNKKKQNAAPKPFDFPEVPRAIRDD